MRSGVNWMREKRRSRHSPACARAASCRGRARPRAARGRRRAGPRSSDRRPSPCPTMTLPIASRSDRDGALGLLQPRLEVVRHRLLVIPVRRFTAGSTAGPARGIPRARRCARRRRPRWARRRRARPSPDVRRAAGLAVASTPSLAPACRARGSAGHGRGSSASGASTGSVLPVVRARPGVVVVTRPARPVAARVAAALAGQGIGILPAPWPWPSP